MIIYCLLSSTSYQNLFLENTLKTKMICFHNISPTHTEKRAAFSAVLYIYLHVIYRILETKGRIVNLSNTCRWKIDIYCIPLPVKGEMPFLECFFGIIYFHFFKADTLNYSGIIYKKLYCCGENKQPLIFFRNRQDKS